MKFLLVSFLVFFLSCGAFAIPTQPLVTGAVQLGSERLWERIDSRFTAKVSASVARSNFVTLVAIDSEGRAWRTDSAEYSKAWTQPLRCTDPASCFGSYTPSGKQRTEWGAWSQILTDCRFDFNVKPVVVRDEAGNAFVVVNQISPERRVVAYSMNDASTFTTKLSVSPVLTQNVTSLSAVMLGGRDNVESTAMLVSVYVNGSIFRIFERVGTAAFRERRVAPSGAFQFSEHAPRFQVHGVGNMFATYFYFSGGNWIAQAFEHIPGSESRLYEARPLAQLTMNEAPQVLWQPGNYAHGLFLQDSLLRSNLGLFNKQNFGLPTQSTQVSASPMRYFEAFNHYSDAFVVSVHTDGSTRLFRFGTELERGTFQQLASVALGPTADIRSLDVVQLGTEIYASAVISTGRVVWINLIRAAAEQMSQAYWIVHYAPPTMGLPYDSLLSFSNFGQAFWSVPLDYHQLYRAQPASRCHPAGFTPPIACGKVFFEWNDYWGVPARPGQWQTRDMAIAAETDSDPNTSWPLGWLKSFMGSVVLKSGFNSTQSIFHEFMHEFDFDGIRGTLVPGAGSFLPDYNRLFNDRSSSGVAARNTGFVSSYATSNYAEDWAETASYYRFQGAWFRFLAAVDAELGDTRLQQKYDLAKRVFRNKEFSNFGTLAFGSTVLVPLVQMRHATRSDMVPVASAHEARMRINEGYSIYAGEAWAFSQQLEGTIPLRLFVHRNGNLAAGASVAIASTLRARGFSDTGTVLGYIYATQRPGTRALRLYARSTPSFDTTSTSDPNIQRTLRDWRYVEGGIDGYVLESAAY